MKVLSNIFNFITDPKNLRLILLGGIVILVLLFLRQCNATQHYKDELEFQKQETQRVQNNYDAAVDTIEQYQVDEDTWAAEKLGYELTLEEAKENYADLLADFNIEKNKPPKTIIKTEFVVRDSIRDVPILVEIDSLGNRSMAFKDSTRHDSLNYRVLDGRIPYEIVFDPIDSVYRLVPEPGSFNITTGMNLNLGLFQDKDTRKVSIVATTNYPGVTFTNINGANFMDDPKNKKVLRKMRKPWGLGVNLGYGVIVDTKTGLVRTGPYFGIGISYSPKFLQWGR